MDLAPGNPDEALQVRQNDQFIEIEERGYRLEVSLEKPEVELFLGNRQVATLDIASALDTMEAFDDKTELGRAVLRPGLDGCYFTFRHHLDMPVRCG